MKSQLKIEIGMYLSFLLLLISPLFSFSPAIGFTTCKTTAVNLPAGVITPTLHPECAGGAQEVIKLARTLLDKKYVFGGPSPRDYQSWDPATNPPPNGDCSFLVGWSWYWATNGKVNIPAQTGATWKSGNPDLSKFQKFTPDQVSQIKVGDAIYWTSNDYIHHTALYSGPCQRPENGAGNCIIEAQQTGVPIKESRFDSRTKGTWAGFLRPIGY